MYISNYSFNLGQPLFVECMHKIIHMVFLAFVSMQERQMVQNLSFSQTVFHQDLENSCITVHLPGLFICLALFQGWSSFGNVDLKKKFFFKVTEF